MRESVTRAASIIGVLLVALLVGCSALRVVYGNGPQLAWWWLDGYVDFSRDQVARAKAAIDGWFAWHRSTQAPAWAALLSRAAAEVQSNTTPEAACRWRRQVRDALEPSLDEALRDLADLIPAFGEPQLRHLEERFAKNRRELQDDYLQPDPQDRSEAAVERVVEQAERLYGRLNRAQRRVVAEGVAASPFDPQAWLHESERRHREIVDGVRRLASAPPGRDETAQALRTLVERAEHSADPTYRAYQERLHDYNCAFAARIHNAATPAQREQARERLNGWAADLRSFSAAPTLAQPAGS